MSQNNDFNEKKVLRFLAKLILIGGVILIIAALLWGVSIISTKLFIAFAIIGGILLLLPILAVVTKAIINSR